MSKVPFFLEFPKKQISSVYYSTKITGGSRLRLSLGVSVETKFWDANKYRVRLRWKIQFRLPPCAESKLTPEKTL